MTWALNALVELATTLSSKTALFGSAGRNYNSRHGLLCADGLFVPWFGGLDFLELFGSYDFTLLDRG
jgi:hypothetical protein